MEDGGRNITTCVARRGEQGGHGGRSSSGRRRHDQKGREDKWHARQWVAVAVGRRGRGEGDNRRQRRGWPRRRRGHWPGAKWKGRGPLGTPRAAGKSGLGESAAVVTAVPPWRAGWGGGGRRRWAVGGRPPARRRPPARGQPRARRAAARGAGWKLGAGGEPDAVCIRVAGSWPRIDFSGWLNLRKTLAIDLEIHRNKLIAGNLWRGTVKKTVKTPSAKSRQRLLLPPSDDRHRRASLSPTSFVPRACHPRLWSRRRGNHPLTPRLRIPPARPPPPPLQRAAGVPPLHSRAARVGEPPPLLARLGVAAPASCRGAPVTPLGARCCRGTWVPAAAVAGVASGL